MIADFDLTARMAALEAIAPGLEPRFTVAETELTRLDARLDAIPGAAKD